MASFSFSSFIIGLLLGMILMLLLVWIAYYSRSFLFTYCPTQMTVCTAADYYNNPGDALANGANIDDILFLNDKNELFYQRVPNNANCIPSSNQTVEILYPQYCEFSGDGITGVTGKAIQFNSATYNVSEYPTVDTVQSCIPVAGSYVDMGVPLIKWDINPIS